MLEDTIIEVSFKDEDKIDQKVKLRKVRFYDRNLKREFEFPTNLIEMRSDFNSSYIQTALAN